MAAVKGWDILGSKWTDMCWNMGKWKDLSNSDEGQIMNARWLGQSILKQQVVWGILVISRHVLGI